MPINKIRQDLFLQSEATIIECFIDGWLKLRPIYDVERIRLGSEFTTWQVNCLRPTVQQPSFQRVPPSGQQTGCLFGPRMEEESRLI